jgi:sigma-B regulation protein RsbU (phosphoserine phosphatase)
MATATGNVLRTIGGMGLLATTAEPQPNVLHIVDAGGAVSQLPLAGSRAVIGRAQDADVKLDSGMVSRHHAELTRDAFGRWTVHDLHSRNGTMVNGVAVTAQQLETGDRVGIGPYTLTLAAAAEDTTSLEPPTRSRLLLSDAAAGRISTLKDVEPPRLAASHLTTLSNLSRDLLASDDPAARLTALCRLMVGRDFHGRRAYALRLSEANPDQSPSPLCEPQQAEDLAGIDPYGASGSGSGSQGTGVDPSAYISQGVLRAVRHKGEAVLAGNTGHAGDIELSISSSILPVSAVAVPLRQDPGGFDILYVTLPPEYGNGEWLALTALAAKQYQQAEDAWTARKQAEAHAAVELELHRAQQIQMRLVPQAAAVEGLDLAIGFVPCRWVGGDYVDVVPMKDGRTLLTVADVCGKGLPAALISSSLHTMVHTALDAGMGLAGMMASLNRYLCQTLSSESFVTMVAVAIDPRTGELECVNAGHPPALLLTPGAEPVELQSAANMPLSCDSEDPKGEASRIESGQLLCLYTDGLTELCDPSGHMLGINGLSSQLKLIFAPSPRAPEVAEALTRELDALQGHRIPDDDRTFLLAKRL